MSKTIKCRFIKDSGNRILFLFLFWGMVSTVVGRDKVYIYDKTGERISFSIDSGTTVTVNSDNIIVNCEDKQVLFPLSDYLKFIFEKESSSIKSVTNSDKEIFCRIEGEDLYLMNLPPWSIVRVYSLSGALVDSAQSDTEGSLILNLGKMGKQVVVVQTVYKSFKICL